MNSPMRLPPVIGVFDSGIGGLTVVKTLAEKLSGASFVYFGDTSRFPYGPKSASTITRYAIENASFLLEQGATVIVVACNTATSVAFGTLSSMLSIPVFGVIQPAAQKAVMTSRSGKIGVIGTTMTIRAESYKKAITEYMPEAIVTSVACPLLASMIEEGCPHEEARRLIVREYLRPLREAGVDTLLLGCTHYPLATALIQEEVGSQVTIINPAVACAENIAKQLPPWEKDKPTQFRFFASDDPERFKVVGGAFLGMNMEKVSLAIPSQ